MPHLPLEQHLPGITGLLEYRRDSAEPIRELTQFLLRGPNTLTTGERELIATIVSSSNQCQFCTAAHATTADLIYGREKRMSECVIGDIESAPLPEKTKALLQVAKLVGQGGLAVTTTAIARAKQAGATDVEIHDTVLIAALFCLYNRYVDGLATSLPAKPEYFATLADRLVHHGYTRLPQGYDHLKKQA